MLLLKPTKIKINLHLKFINNPYISKPYSSFKGAIINLKKTNMKRIITLFFALATISLSFAQSNANNKVKRSAQEAKVIQNNIESTTESRAVDCLWESDFSSASDWTLDHDATDCSLDWEIGQNLECTGFYPMLAIESANGYYAMVDSDAYGGEEGGTDVEDSWMTMSNPVDLSNVPNVIVEMDTWYQSYNSEKCFLVVSTDGTFPTDLTPATEADPANGIYEIFPGISGEAGTDVGDNPTTTRINISEAAGGQSQVWVRFNWTGTWGYAWFIDNVCIAEQPADDITLTYGVVSHNGTGMEYGRVPNDQIAGDMSVGAGVYNFGVNVQDNVSVEMEIEDTDTYVVATSSNFNSQLYNATTGEYEDISGSMISGADWYFEDTTPSLDAGTYTAHFDVSSDGDSGEGELGEDNSVRREFSITDNIYSIDGIDIYTENIAITRIGTGSFTDATDGFVMMTYYDISSGTDVAGARIILDSYAYTSPLTVPGGELVVALRDTVGTAVGTTFAAENSIVATSDFYLVTQADIDMGFIDVAFTSPYYASPNAYMLSVEMYSNGNGNDIYILDDETVPQPGNSSMIYIPGDQAYTNGTAAGIRMLMGSSIGLDEELSNLNVYPNPSNGIINIEISESNKFTVTINDILGKVISTDEINSTTTLDLQHLDKGVYFVNISNSTVTNTTKVIID